MLGPLILFFGLVAGNITVASETVTSDEYRIPLLISFTASFISIIIFVWLFRMSRIIGKVFASLLLIICLANLYQTVYRMIYAF